MSEIKTVDTAAIRKRWAAASRGDWSLDRALDNGPAFKFAVRVAEEGGHRAIAHLPVGDAAFIAGAHADVPALLDLVERQTRALLQVQAYLYRELLDDPTSAEHEALSQIVRPALDLVGLNDALACDLKRAEFAGQ